MIYKCDAIVYVVFFKVITYNIKLKIENINMF